MLRSAYKWEKNATKSIDSSRALWTNECLLPKSLKTAKSKISTRPILGICFFLTLIFGKCFGFEDPLWWDGLDNWWWQLMHTSILLFGCCWVSESTSAPMKVHMIIDSSDLIIDTIFKVALDAVLIGALFSHKRLNCHICHLSHNILVAVPNKHPRETWCCNTHNLVP